MAHPASDGGTEPGPAAPATGDARVDEAVSRLGELAELPVTEHPAVFEHIHQQLTEALGELDSRDLDRRQDPGPARPPAP